MSKREKIIIGITVLAAIYGMFNFLFLSAQPVIPSAGAGREEETQFISDIAVGLRQGESFPHSGLIPHQAPNGWNSDPFIASVSRLSQAPKPATESEMRQESEIQTRQMIYSGYLRMGDRFLAIINGTEYEIGDELEGGDYVVHGITPQNLTLRGKDKRNFTLRLTEEGAPSG